MALKVRPAGLKCVHLRKISLLYYFEIHFISDLNAFLFLLQLKWVYLKANLLEVGLDPIQLRKYSSKNAKKTYSLPSYDTVNYDKRHTEMNIEA